MTTQFDPEDAEDPLVTKYVEAALAPYVGRMPAEDLEVFREWLYLFYETNPVAVALLDEIREARRPSPTVARSGDQVRPGVARFEDGGKKRSRR